MLAKQSTHTHTICWRTAVSTWQVWGGSCKFHLHARTAKWICKHAKSLNLTSPQPVTGTGNNWQQLTSITIYTAVWWKKKLSMCVCVCVGGGFVVTWDLLPIVLYMYNMTEHHMNNDTKNCIKEYYPVPTMRNIFCTGFPFKYSSQVFSFWLVWPCF